MADANAFLIYQDDNGVSNVNVRFKGEDVCAGGGAVEANCWEVAICRKGMI